MGKSAVLHEVDGNSFQPGYRMPPSNSRSWLGAGRPGPATARALVYGNLTAVWADYMAHGARQLVIGMLLEDRAGLVCLTQAIPDAQPTVVRLSAPLAMIEQRLRRREQQVEDDLVDNGQRSVSEVAREILRLADWLPPTS